MRDRFGATNAKSQMVRFHTQTGGVTLTAQQPENNIVRVALQGFAAVCGGTQSLHTNGFDEALGLPTERSAKIALRTQQVIAHESGAADTVDPFAGSYYVEALTDEIEARAQELMEKVEELGGSVERDRAASSARDRGVGVGLPPALRDQAGHPRRRERVRRRERPIDVEILKIDPKTEREQVERLKAFKENRDQDELARRLEDLREVAQGDGNLLHPIKDALAATPRSARSAA